MSFRELIEEYSENFSDSDMKMVLRDELVYNVTEDLLVQMEKQGLNKQQLARKIGKSRSYVTQLLSGKRNMTLGSLSDICYYLNIEPKLNLKAYLNSEKKKSIVKSMHLDIGDGWKKSESDSSSGDNVPNKRTLKNVIYKQDRSDWERAA